MVYTFLENYITAYKIYNKIKPINNNKIIKYILNCHGLIKIFIIFQSLIFNFFSLLFYLNLFGNIELKKKLYLQKFLKKNFFLTSNQ